MRPLVGAFSQAQRRHLAIGIPKKPSLPPSLEGQVAWVAGGVGIVGAGICRGLLRAGATVLVNSRHGRRLEQLADELGHPERLICVTGSMLPEHAASTIQTGLERTNGQLNHVVAHCAVRWWARDHGDESSTMLRNTDSLLGISPEDFPVLASQLASLHFAAAHHMMPRLVEGGSYTWVTGGGPAQMRSVPGVRSSLGHVNAAVVYGLAGALRSELEGSPLRVSELRVREYANHWPRMPICLKTQPPIFVDPAIALPQVSNGLNRPASERKLDLRETPLSHQLSNPSPSFSDIHVPYLCPPLR
jgi:NAD(P)-dependent dehydrogenase (short-subunit alcohol dehydrogenase family)